MSPGVLEYHKWQQLATKHHTVTAVRLTKARFSMHYALVVSVSNYYQYEESRIITMEKVTRISNVLYLVGSYFIDMVCQNNLERSERRY